MIIRTTLAVVLVSTVAFVGYRFVGGRNGDVEEKSRRIQDKINATLGACKNGKVEGTPSLKSLPLDNIPNSKWSTRETNISGESSHTVECTHYSTTTRDSLLLPPQNHPYSQE